MKRNFRFLQGLMVILGCAFGLPSVAGAQIRLKPAGRNAFPLRAHTVKANVTIHGQYALTQTQTTFQNETSERIEADFIYTVPPHAVVTYFAYWYGREKVVARVVEKKRAAKIYDYITTRQRDPALIEMVGKDTFRARIFPIMPNADLKIEIHLVQVLPGDAGGTSFVFPLRPKEKGTGTLDSLDVSVRVLPDAGILRVTNNLNQPVTRNKNGYHLRLHQLNFRAAQDWRIGLIKQKRPLRVSAYAARSGGSDGFFALTLTPSVSLSKPSLQLTGVATYDVMPARLPALQAGQSFTIVGRYRRSGTVRVALSGIAKAGRWSAEESVRFTAQREDNNLATKLWAARRIAALSASSRGRATVIALSQRYTLPSQWTSWLAIPQEERERYHAERIRADLDVIGVQWMELIAKGQGKSRRALQLATQFKAMCRREKLDYAQEKGHLNWRWAEVRLTEDTEALTRQIALGRGKSRHAQTLRRSIQWLAKRGNLDARSQLQNSLSQRLGNIAKEIVDHTYGPSRNTRRVATLRRELKHLAKAEGSSETFWLNSARAEWAGQELQYLAEALAEEKFSPGPNAQRLKQLRRDLERVRKLAATTDLKSTLESAESSIGWQRLQAITRRWLSETHRPRPDKKRLAQMRPELNRWLKIKNTNLENAIDSVKFEWARDEMNRILPEITGELEKDSPNKQLVRELLTQHRAIFDKFFKWNYGVSDEIAEGVKQVESLQSQIAGAKKAGHAKKLKQLHNRKVELLADLDTRQMEFSYGGSGGAGDPLIHVAAPADAAQVVALLPGGEIKRLVFNAAASRWEARFDIPTYVEDGEFPIQILVVFKDGRRQHLVMNFNVDNTPPSGKGTAKLAKSPQPSLHLSADVSPHTARVAALMPWGAKVDLQPSTLRANRFVLNLPLPGNWTKTRFAVTYMLTDSAHNRTMITVDLEK